MSFSLRTLLAVVLVAAIFAATIFYLSLPSTIIAVSLTLIYLFVGTLGVWVGTFKRQFWIPACVVGWVYLGICFSTGLLRNLGALMPSRYVSEAIWNNAYSDSSPEPPMILGNASAWTLSPPLSDRKRVLFFEPTIDSIFTLIFSTLAGVIASVLLRHKPVSVPSDSLEH